MPNSLEWAKKLEVQMIRKFRWLLILMSLALAGCQTTNRTTGGSPTQTGTPSPRPEGTEQGERVIVPSDWRQHSSSRYSYTFAYPPDWTFYAYDEDNPEVMFGSHTLQNYNPEEAQQLSQRGMINWSELMGETPVVKMDITVRSLDELSYEDFVAEYTDGATSIPETDLRIGKLITQKFESSNLETGPFKRAVTYVAQVDSTRAVAVIRYSPSEDDTTLHNSPLGEEVRILLSSFAFEQR